MGSAVLRIALVGTTIVLASGRAFGEAQPPRAAPPQAKVAPPQQAPQPQPAPQQPAPQQPQQGQAPQQAPQPKTAPVPKKQAKRATPKAKAPLPPELSAGDGAQSRPQPSCTVVQPKGTPIFEARYASGAKSIITKLYATGTFTRLVVKQSPLRTSCIESDRLSAIRSALAEAPWQTTKRPPSCAATSKETTEIYASGKLRFTSRECNPLVLDVQSSKALDLIGTYVGPFGLDLADMIEAD